MHNKMNNLLAYILKLPTKHFFIRPTFFFKICPGYMYLS